MKTKIFFYCRHALFNHMLNASREGKVQFKGDNIAYYLYEAVALILLNQLEEGIQHLEKLLSEKDVKLAATVALKFTHQIMGSISKEYLSRLEDQIEEIAKSSKSIAFYHCAFSLMAFKQLENSLKHIDQSLIIHNDDSDHYILKGWILLELENDKLPKDNSILNLFQRALQLNPKNLDGIIGISEFYLENKNFTEALNIINKTVVQFTLSDMPLTQKLRIQFGMLDWDQVIDTVNRLIANNTRNVYAKRMFITTLLCYSANYEHAVKELSIFKKILDTEESNNSTYLLECSKLFSRICNKNNKILAVTSTILENALNSNSENLEVLVEMGNQCLMRNDIKSALRFFRSALKINKNCFEALYGVSLCDVKNGITDELSNQIEILSKITNKENVIYFNFLQAKFSQPHQAVEHLLKICEIKLSLLKFTPFSEKYLLILDPSFILDVINEYIIHLSCAKQHNNNSIHEILKIIIKCCPGLKKSLFLLAKIQFISGDVKNALKNLEELVNNAQEPFSEAYLLLAQIQIQLGHYDRASQSLEICVSQNFHIRENPTYYYILAITEKNSGNYPDALNFFSTALSLMSNKSTEINPIEKATIYIELIDTLNVVGQTDEAAKTLEVATNELKGTPEEARILLLSAEQLLKRKNIQGTLDLLSNIKPTDSCYKEAKAKHAEILLKYRKDKNAYIQCYKNFAEETSDVESYSLIGDAYMRILEPDYALEYYEKALKESPKDFSLIAKMGQALVDAHYFIKAINYYKNAIKNTKGDATLKLKLAELYMNLKQYDKAELILLDELDEDKLRNVEDLNYMNFKTEILVLLSLIREKSGNLHHALKSLEDAFDNQNRLRKRLEIEKTGSTGHVINTQTDISLRMGNLAILLKNNEKAISFYKEGLQISPNKVQILVALSKLYMQINNLELCQQTCSTILKIDPENEVASVLLADIAFRKIDFGLALFHFTQLVTKQPTNWEALIRLIEILRRTANIDDCPKYLKDAEEHCCDPKKEAKLFYCMGLFQWYSGNLNGALRNFNFARNDATLGLKALYNMIEICLFPDDEIFTEQFVENDDNDYKDSRAMALKTVERLLKELKKSEMNSDEILNYELLTNLHLLASREKYNVETALENLIAIASHTENKEHLGVIYGISLAYTLLKQGQRAKNQLKRVVKCNWNFEDAKYLERCWLLLVEYYVQSSKYEIATDLINKVIQHNKSCLKSYQYLGFVLEKEQRYKDAVASYELAWNIGGKANASVGFKLSYCLMKCKKYSDAINKAQEVLKINPDHPRVRKDILDKCINNLRI